MQHIMYILLWREIDWSLLKVHWAVFW